FMTRAIALALQNVRTGKGGPFAALIVRQNRILAEGVNQVTTANDPTAHAEILAIRRACQQSAAWQLTGSEIYTTCEPCPMCLGAIYWARLDRVYYACSRFDAASAGFDDSLIYAELAIAPELRRVPMHQALREPAVEIFSAWTAQPGKVPY
ncbi:MAG: nucleoside deaminase, partial [Acidobacteria bacterium]|nr:nucleoside deaminase [Acidobacteriota bacterium]